MTKVREQLWERGLSRTKRTWLVFFLLAVLVRVLLPGGTSDTTLVHAKIVESLMAGHNWGRQALVGACEYPLLPTLSLLLASVLGRPLAVDGVRLLTAVAQVWTLCYLARFPRTLRARYCTGISLGVAMLFPEVREAMWTLDPNWVTLVAAASAVYHAERWLDGGLLRDGIVGAIACGLLALAGIVPALFAATTLWAMCSICSPGGSPGDRDREGVSLLIWAPFLYGVFLWLLWNWLLLDNMLFGLSGLWHWFTSSGGWETAARFGHEIMGSSRPLLALSGVLLLCWSVTRSRFVAYLLVAGAVVLTGRSLLQAVHVYAAGGTLLGCLLSVIGGSWIAAGIAENRLPWKETAVPSCLVVLTALLLAWSFPAQSLVREASFSRGAPRRKDVTDYIDQFWPRSRVMLYGVRIPALYHDPTEERFVASIDYHEGLFIEKALEEQLHLLVPPPDGGFFPEDGYPFADIHRWGRSWLLLEKQWASGWQLWRCVIPPKGESRLEGFQ